MLVLSSSTFEKQLEYMNYFITFSFNYSRTLLQGLTLSASSICSGLLDYFHQHKIMLKFSPSLNSTNKQNSLEHDYPSDIIAFFSCFVSEFLEKQSQLTFSNFSLQIHLVLTPPC